MNIHHRPVTSKARGICKYHPTERGCYAGRNCKFLHSNEPAIDPSGSRPPILTPYDQSKRCRHFANGYCKRGDKCWFIHFLDPKQARVDDTEPCSICFEKPSTYGLLVGCSHIFCIDCLRRWRNPKKNLEGNSENAKRCPMCRTLSPYIIPSSRFWKDGQEEKTKALENYKTTMSHVDCKYFALSLHRNPQKPTCPFGNDCFYRHSNPDGTPHRLEHGFRTSMRNWERRRNLPRLHIDGNQDTYTNIINFLDRVVAEFVEATSPEVPGSRPGSRTRSNEANTGGHIGLVAAAIRDQLDSLDWDTTGRSASSNWVLDAGWGWNDESATDVIITDDTPIWGMDAVEEVADGGWPVWDDSSTNTSHDTNTHLMRQLESLADQMLGPQHDIQTDSSPPPLEPISVLQPAEDIGDPETPAHQHPVSEPASREIEETSSSNQTPPRDTTPVPTTESTMEAAGEGESHSPLGVPPFVTDGRGRVVWSNKDAQGHAEHDL